MIPTAIRATRCLVALASIGLAGAAIAQDAPAAQGADAQAVAPKPVNTPSGGAGGGDAPTMGNVDKPAPAPKAPAAAKSASANSGYTDIPFQKGDPEAPGNPAGDRRTHINASVAWQKHWVDHGFEKVTDPSNRTTVILDGAVY